MQSIADFRGRIQACSALVKFRGPFASLQMNLVKDTTPYSWQATALRLKISGRPHHPGSLPRTGSVVDPIASLTATDNKRRLDPRPKRLRRGSSLMVKPKSCPGAPVVKTFCDCTTYVLRWRTFAHPGGLPRTEGNRSHTHEKRKSR